MQTKFQKLFLKWKYTTALIVVDKLHGLKIGKVKVLKNIQLHMYTWYL